MKLRKGQKTIAFGNGILSSAYLIDQDRNFLALWVISAKQIQEEEQRNPHVGIPTYIAQINSRTVKLYPIPDRSYEVKIRWYSYHET